MISASRMFLYVNRFVLCAALTLLPAIQLYGQKKLTVKVAPNDSSVSSLLDVQPQYASITATNDALQITRMPVTYQGVTYYADVNIAMQIALDTDGTVNAVLTPTVVESPSLIANSFQAGTYVGPSNVNGGKNIIVVSGPSPLAGGGSAWSLAVASTGSTATYPSTAVWYVESSNANNPLAARISAAKITSTAYSFGEGTSGSEPNYSWYANSLLGFVQVGNSLTISCFTGYDGDQSTPADTITYTLQQPQ